MKSLLFQVFEWDIKISGRGDMFQKLINNSCMSSTTYHVRWSLSRARVLNPGKTLSNFKNFILISILYIKNTNKEDIYFIARDLWILIINTATDATNGGWIFIVPSK